MYNASNMTMRMTPQTKLVLLITNKLGHATNAEILKEAKKRRPNISATTIHRITTRLVLNDLLTLGPDFRGVMTIDANTKRHDHFICEGCSGIKDVYIGRIARDELRRQVDGMRQDTVLAIFGDCHSCK